MNEKERNKQKETKKTKHTHTHTHTHTMKQENIMIKDSLVTLLYILFEFYF